MEELGWKLDKLILNNEKYLGLTVTPITSTTPMKDEFIKAVWLSMDELQIKQKANKETEVLEALINDETALRYYGNQKLNATLND